MNGLDFCQPLPPSTPTKKPQFLPLGRLFWGFLALLNRQDFLKKNQALPLFLLDDYAVKCSFM